MFSETTYRSFAIENQLNIVEGKGGFPTIQINNKHANAVISIYGAQVLSYLPKNQTEDLLFVSESAYFEENKAIKGGIPICWPWFGHDQEVERTRIHGFARNMLWQLEETSTIKGGETIVVLSLRETEETKLLWPHSFKLTLKIQIGKTLRLSLKTENTDNSPFVITQALHAYFAIADIHQTKVLGLNGVTYLDKVGGEMDSKVQRDDVVIDQEVDRIYTDAPSELSFIDKNSPREVRINSNGSNTAVVWNPWVDICKNSGDLTDDAYQQFVCIETANAVEDKVIVEPNGSYTIEAEYSIIEA